MTERLVREIEIPPPAAGDWRMRLGAVMRSYRRMVHRHPHAFLLRVTRVGRTSEGPHTVEAVLEIIRGAGLALLRWISWSW